MKAFFSPRLHILVLAALLVAGCSKNSSNPAEDTDHAAITTILLQFKQAGVTKFEFGFDDPDGDGGNSPIRFDNIVLPRGQVYQVDVVLQNKVSGTVKDMTAVIRDAGRFHEFFFLPSGVAVDVVKNDRDMLGFPLGLQSTWTTPAVAGSGKMKVTLQHLLVKKAVNQPTDGHSDINVDFNIQIN